MLKNEIKLCTAILGQCIIDIYKGPWKAREEALEWFHGEGYSAMVGVLKGLGVRFKDLFPGLNKYSWQDIPGLASASPISLYMSYRAIPYLEGVDHRKVVYIQKRGKIALDQRRGRKIKGPAQLVIGNVL